MTKEDKILNALITELDNCYQDSEYGQNTLNDLLLHGFKGLNNMSEDEVSEFLDRAIKWNEGL